MRQKVYFMFIKSMCENIECCIDGKRDSCLLFNYCIRIRSQIADVDAELKISKNTLAIQDSFRPIPKVSKHKVRLFLTSLPPPTPCSKLLECYYCVNRKSSRLATQ